MVEHVPADHVPTRMVTVWCPEWPVVAARVPDDRPAAVFHANRVVSLNAGASQAGVRHHQRRRAAQSACPELDVIVHDPDRDAREFEPVVRAVADMAPRSVVARGPSRYFGGDRAFADRLVEVLAPLAPVAVGVADGRSAATVAARVAVRRAERVIVVEPGGSPEFVRRLPVSWLVALGDATPELVDLFVRLGLSTFGDLADLDPSDVIARFGNEGLTAQRVAGGVDDRLPASTDPPPEWWAEHPFDDPIHQMETVVFVAKRLADGLVERLGSGGRVCTRLVVTFETEHGERSERAWYRDRGLSSVAMVERVRWQLDGWIARPGAITGGVVLVRLVPDEVRRDEGVQSRLWGERSQADHDATRSIVRLTGLAGEAAVCLPVWAGGRLPHERYGWMPATSLDPDDVETRARPSDEPWPGSLPPPSPAVVHDPPAVIDLLDANGVALYVTGRGEISAAPVELLTAGERYDVRSWAGPWPIDQRWWSPDRARRMARLQIVTSDGAAHLVAIEQQRWSLLATYA
jgi:protein ImuB